MCPPGLHISLGIFFRLFTLLEDACHELDVLATQQHTPGSAGPSYARYTDALLQQSTLQDSIETVKAQIKCLEQVFTLTLVTLPPAAPQTNTLLQQIATEISTKKKEIEEMVRHNIIPWLSFSFLSTQGEEEAGDEAMHNNITQT